MRKTLGPAPRFTGYKPSSERASRTKQRVKRKDTGPELLLRRALSTLGVRYRLHDAALPGTPDVVIRRAQVVIFCDGDFWHGRNWGRRSKKLARGSNASYWLAKIEANRKRDRQHTRKLRSMGWTVVRVWESDVVKDAHRQVERIVRAMRQTVRDSPSVLREAD